MKSNIVNIILALLAIAVLNAVAFLPPFVHTAAFWTSYACCWVVIVASFAVSAIVTSGNRQGERILYGFPFYAVASLYLVIGAAFNIVCMAVAVVPTWTVILVNILLLVVFVALFIASGVTRDYLEGQDRKKRESTSFVTALRLQTETLVTASARTGIEKDARALCDAVRFSDPVSSPEVANDESAIMGLVTRAINEINDNNETAAKSTIAQTMVQLEQRNRLLKRFK